MQIKIIENVAAPLRSRKGDFIIPFDKAGVTCPLFIMDVGIATVRARAIRWGKANGIKLYIAKHVDDGIAGVGVWRKE